MKKSERQRTQREIIDKRKHGKKSERQRQIVRQKGKKEINDKKKHKK